VFVDLLAAGTALGQAGAWEEAKEFLQQHPNHRLHKVDIVVASLAIRLVPLFLTYAIVRPLWPASCRRVSYLDDREKRGMSMTVPSTTILIYKEKNGNGAATLICQMPFAEILPCERLVPN